MPRGFAYKPETISDRELQQALRYLVNVHTDSSGDLGFRAVKGAWPNLADECDYQLAWLKVKQWLRERMER